MFKRDELKKKAKGAYYRNWKNCIIIVFLYTLLIGGTIVSLNKEINLDYRDNIKVENIINIKNTNNSDIVNEFIRGISNNDKTLESSLFSDATRGVLGTISNNVSKTGSFLFGILNAINEAIFKDRIWASAIIIVGAIMSLFYWIFVSKVLEVGYARFFLENRKYTRTKANKLIFSYKLGLTKHVALTMFLKNIYTLLWSFTIVGGFIKYYSYQLVPFILAENPRLTSKEVLKLSEEMTYGYKWAMFKLDVTFIGYYLLGLLTFNVANIVFTNPYKNATYAEVYMLLRDYAKRSNISNATTLNDTKLKGEIVFGEYYLEAYSKSLSRRWLRFDYERNYSWKELLLLFFIISIAGWLWEVLLHLFQYGSFVNRGTFYGPWLPIYGGGSIAILVLLKKVRANPFIYFIYTMVVCGIIEYGTSVYLELVHHLSWWDYHGYFLNINGRVCLEGLIFFGVGGVFVTYIIAPLVVNSLDKIKNKTKIIITILLVILFITDFYLSSINPNSGSGITNEIKTSKLNNLKIKG